MRKGFLRYAISVFIIIISVIMCLGVSPFFYKVLDIDIVNDPIYAGIGSLVFSIIGLILGFASTQILYFDGHSKKDDVSPEVKTYETPAEQSQNPITQNKNGKKEIVRNNSKAIFSNEAKTPAIEKKPIEQKSMIKNNINQLNTRLEEVEKEISYYTSQESNLEYAGSESLSRSQRFNNAKSLAETREKLKKLNAEKEKILKNKG